jgi:hypothetical protein
MRTGDATPCEDELIDLLRQKATQWNVISLPRGQAFQDRAATGRIVDIDGIGPTGDDIVKLPSL